MTALALDPRAAHDLLMRRVGALTHEPSGTAHDATPAAPLGRPLRVLFISHTFVPEDAPLSNVGGMQRVATELHGSLGRRGDVELYELVIRSSWKWQTARTVPFMVGLLRRLPAEVKRRGIDVVLFSSATTAIVAGLIAPRLRELGVKTAAIAHGLDVTTPIAAYQLMIRRALRSLDAVFPVSRATGRECVARGCDPERVHVVPNGFDLARFAGRFTERTTAARQPRLRELDLPSDAFTLVSVGRLVKRKGVAWFIERVMPRLAPQVHLLVAGDGPEREQVQAAIERTGLASRVHLLGFVDEAELYELYAHGDLFLMPNVRVPGDMEGFGIVMLEAGACGMPTLAADLEGIRDVIRDGHNGRFVRSEDADAFVAAIEQLRSDPRELAAMSARTHGYVTSTFDWAEVAGQYVAHMHGMWRREQPRRSDAGLEDALAAFTAPVGDAVAGAT
jgi:phosphatidylinositol alpha-1,6-mannosyltransferase